MNKKELPEPLEILRAALTKAGIDHEFISLNEEDDECCGGSCGEEKLGSGLKYDTGKPPISLVDRHAIEEIAKVLAFGANKYAAHNWRGGISYSRLLDAAMRHLFAFADGEDNDPESGLSHIAHAGCCVVFLLGMIANNPEMDDRYVA